MSQQRQKDATAWIRWLETMAGASGKHLCKENQIDILVDAPQFIPRMLDAVAQSKKAVTYQFFGIEADAGGRPFGDALMAASQRGISVKVLLDSVELFIRTNGHWSFLPFREKSIQEERVATQQMLREMEGAGVELFRYGWKYLIRRHHAKTLIADNSLLFIGGFNPTEHNCHWHEVCAVAAGPIVVEGQKEFNQVFRRSGWEVAATDPVAEYSTVANGVSCRAMFMANRPIDREWGLSRFLLQAIEQARSSIMIETGYITYPGVLQRLIAAKQRGVERICIITPAKSNHASVDRKFRKWIPVLVQAGIEVFVYSGMTHAKVMAFDDLLVSIGSANLETFSLKLNNELNLFAIDSEGRLAQRLHEELFDPDMERSFLVTQKNLGDLDAWIAQQPAT